MRQFDFNSSLLPSARPRRDLGATRSEPAIVGFAAFSLLGAIAMSYYCRMGLESSGSANKPAAQTPVYNARAVPRDEMQRPLGAALVNAAPAAGSDNLESIVNDGRRSRFVHADERRAAAAMLTTRESASRYSFPEFDLMQHAAAIGSATALASSVATQSGSANIEAPNAPFGSFAPVPESNGWSFAGAFPLLLCVGERLRRRGAHRTESV